MKKFFLILFIAVCNPIHGNEIETEKQIETDLKIENNSNLQNDTIEELFETELDLAPPKLDSPSFLKVLIRKFGIALVYKYYAFKTWFINKFNSLKTKPK